MSYSDHHRLFLTTTSHLVSYLTISLLEIFCTNSRTHAKWEQHIFHYKFFDFGKNHSLKFGSCMVANPRENYPVKILVFRPDLSSPLNDTKTTVFRSISIFQKKKKKSSTWPRYYRKSYSFSVRLIFCQRAESKRALSQLRCSQFITPTADLDRLATHPYLSFWALGLE